MVHREWFVLISYDISDDRTRTKVSDILLEYGTRVQRSVFECRVTMDELYAIRDRLERMIDWDTDSVRYYFLCSACEPRTLVSGFGYYREQDEDLVL